MRGGRTYNIQAITATPAQWKGGGCYVAVTREWAGKVVQVDDGAEIKQYTVKGKGSRAYFNVQPELLGKSLKISVVA